MYLADISYLQSTSQWAFSQCEITIFESVKIKFVFFLSLF